LNKVVDLLNGADKKNKEKALIKQNDRYKPFNNKCLIK